MTEVRVETHVKCQLSILTTITDCHQTFVQKKVPIPNYIKIGSRVLNNRADRLRSYRAHFFFGNFSFTDAPKGVQKWTSYEPDRRTNNGRTVNRRTQEETQEPGPCVHQDVVHLGSGGTHTGRERTPPPPSTDWTGDSASPTAVMFVSEPRLLPLLGFEPRIIQPVVLYPGIHKPKQRTDLKPFGAGIIFFNFSTPCI